jgi:hypothetical protein
LRRAGLFFFALARPFRGPDVKPPKQKRGQKTPMRERVLALDAPLTSLADDQVLSFHEWCALNRISERTGRRILANPGGPQVVQLSARRVGVTIGANWRWQQQRSRAP